MTSTVEEGPGRAFWIAMPAGVALMAFGIKGALHDHAVTQPTALGRWLLEAGIVHDALIAPVAVVIGAATVVLPRPSRSPVRIALALSALLVAFTWPLVQGWGRRATNPSALPLDYGRNVAIGLAVIWIVACAAILIQARRDRR